MDEEIKSEIEEIEEESREEQSQEEDTTPTSDTETESDVTEANSDTIDDTSSEEVEPNESGDVFIPKTDYSWIDSFTDEDINKAFNTQWENATAEIGTSTEPRLTTSLDPGHEENKAKTMESSTKDEFDFSNAEPIKTKEVGVGPFKHSVIDYSDKNNRIEGLYTPEQVKRIEDSIESLGSKTAEIITKTANTLTMGLAPATKTSNFNPDSFKEAIKEQIEGLGDNWNEQKVSNIIRDTAKMASNAQAGLVKDDLDYYKLTGDAIGEKSQKVDAILQNAIVDVVKGDMTLEQYTELYDKITNPSNSDYLSDLWDKTKGFLIYGAATAAGKLASYGIKKVAPKVLEKALQSDSKIAKKIIESVAKNKTVQNRYKYDQMKDLFEAGQINEAHIADLQGMYENALEAGDTEAAEMFLRSIRDVNPELASKTAQEAGDYKGYLDSIFKVGESPVGENASTITDMIKGLKENPSEYADWFVGMAKDLGYAKPADMAKAVLEAMEQSDTVKNATRAGVVGGTIATTAEKAEAVPTGIFDEKGRMIDSKEIVKERQDNPYTGDDAITLQSREGLVTVDPREAVIIGESENLTPTQGYTEEVKEKARQENRQVYESEKVEMIQPTQHDLSVWDKAVDYVQAILGGRDLNNDKTITKDEWYNSTIGPVVDSIKETFSLPSPKEVFNSAREKVSRWADRVGGNIAASIPGVINLSTGEIQVVDKEVPASEDQMKLLQTKIVDSLPSWGDDAKSDMMKSTIADTVGSVLEPMYGNVGVITLVKAAGTYATKTIAEISHLNGYDLSEDQKGAINFGITNAIGLTFEPVSTLVRDITTGVGLINRVKIEGQFSGESGLVGEGVYIIPYDSGLESVGEYGSSSGVNANDVDNTYSGYREQAKGSNVAEDYNRGLEKNINTTVSDMHSKVFKIYSSEPDYIRNAIRKVLQSYKELY